MSEFTKHERQVLRALAVETYEAEAASLLMTLEDSFKKWRTRELHASELLEEIHRFHQTESRELWSMYQGLRDPYIVARGIAHGLLSSSSVETSLREKIMPLVDAFRP